MAIGLYNRLRPFVYVADLAAYNSGFRHGEWLDPTQGKDILQERIKEMLSRSPIHELYPDQAVKEFAIHDYDDFGEAEGRLGEYPNFDELVETACFISEQGRLGSALVGYYHSVGYSDSLKEAKNAIKHRYCGQYVSVKDFAEELLLLEGLSAVEYIESEYPRRKYYDPEEYARDLELNESIFTIKLRPNQLHIFWTI